jgi:hypothetical protein
MTLPATRHLDALVAKHVVGLDDVRLGWAFGSDAQSLPTGDRSYYPRDYIYRAREPWGPDSGYERVPEYASDGNDMLGLIEHLARQGVALATASNNNDSGKAVVRVSDGKLNGYGRGDTIPEAVALAAMDLAERHARWDGDQSFDVRRELQRLEAEYQEAIKEGVKHA